GCKSARALMTCEPCRQRPILVSYNTRAKKVRELGCNLYFFLERHSRSAAKEIRVTRHFSQCGSDEELEADHRRDRVARKSEPRDAIEQAERERRPRSHFHLPELLLSPKPRKDIARMIEIAYRDSGGCEDQIVPRGALQLFLERCPCITRYSKILGDSTRHARQRFERITIGRNDAPRGDHLVEIVEIHELVAGADDRNARASEDLNRGDTGRCQHPQQRRLHRSSAFREEVTGLVILAGAANVPPPIAPLAALHPLASAVGVFLANHGISATWDRRSRHDAHRFTALQSPRRKLSGRDRRYDA